MKKLILLLPVLILLSLTACKEKPLPFDNFNSDGDITDSLAPVALVGTDTITLNEFNQGLNDDGFHRKDFTDTLAFKAETLKRLILDHAARFRAPDYPIEIDRELQVQMDDHLNATLRFILFENEIKSRIEISDEEIEQFYEANKESFKVPATASVAHILATTEKSYLTSKLDLGIALTKEVRDSIARAKMDIIVAELESGRPFEEVAREYSDDSVSAQNGGMLDFKIKEGDAAYYFDSVVFKEPIDTFHGPVETTYGYHMVKVHERVPEYYYDLDSALEAHIREVIEQNKSRGLAAEFFDSLHQKIDISFNPAFSDGSEHELSDDDWAIIIDDTDTVDMFVFREYAEREENRLQRDSLTMRIKHELLSRMADLWMLSYESKKRGNTESPEYKKAHEEFLFREKLKRLKADRAPGNIEPTEDEMRAYYEAHKHQYTEDSMLAIQQLVVEDRAVAEQFKTRVDSGENFQWAAMDYAQGETEDIKRMTINLGWITPAEISADFFKKIYKYEIGSVTPPIKSDWGWHVVKIQNKTGIKDFKAVRVEVRKQMLAQRRQAFVDEWEAYVLADLDIKIDYELFRDFPFTVDWLPRPDIQKMMRGF